MKNAIRTLINICICTLTVVGCARESQKVVSAAPARVPGWTFEWRSGEARLICTAPKVAVGAMTANALQITGAGLQQPFTIQPFGSLLSVNFMLLDSSGTTLLILGWTAGANTYSVNVYRYTGHSVEEIADILVDVPEYGVVDIDGDGVSEIIALRRAAPLGVDRTKPYDVVAYKWTGRSFVKEDIRCQLRQNSSRKRTMGGVE